MRIAAAQIVTGKDPQANLELIRQWTQKAAAAGAEVIVFPEASQRSFGHSLTPIAEPLDGEWAQQVRAVAEEFGVILVVGMFTPGRSDADNNERVTNTLLVTGRDAQGQAVETSYDKLHLYDAFGFEESRTVQPGEQQRRFSASGLSLGLATCYDVRFPQLFQAHAAAGALATLLPASWGDGPGKVDQWQLLVRARALDATAYVVACGQAKPSAAGIEAPSGAPTGVGHSMIVAPDGEVIAEAGEAPELLVADVDPERVAAVRQTLPVLKNARPL